MKSMLLLLPCALIGVLQVHIMISGTTPGSCSNRRVNHSPAGGRPPGPCAACRPPDPCAGCCAPGSSWCRLGCPMFHFDSRGC
ncbi:hypothetical protein PF011_g11053 [Phytophthora fragariae]|uniref:Uncharacterized protein n=1 Tax=Phytophthora fragariae TaxID=53985 RepID=A0A6A3KJQ2_9STRA|nr:hypothetical protein PF011_g11053 [Phytophthora fragariae]